VVPYPRTPRRPRRLRSLNRPRPARVDTNDNGVPIATHISGRRLAVESALETWRIDDEWWRPHPVSRLYWRVLLEDGRVVDVFRNLITGSWARQTY
jgi:hypothetical protein